MSDTHSRFNGPTRSFAAILIPIFAFQFVCPPAVRAATATAASVLGLPVPGAMVSRSQGYTPTLIKGIRPDPENPLQMNFIIESGDSRIEGEAFNQEARKLIKYFLTALTVPPKELWVNLSPVEKDRLIPEGLGETEMGRDMLAQDYLLKQLTASLMYPEEELGKGFWDRVYAKAKILYGTTNIPISTFNKVWIVPDAAGVYEYQGSAYVIRSHLKVMLEEDYQALQANRDNAMLGMDRVADDDAKVVNRVSSDVVREVLIPEIEKEINEGKTFANLRQIYDAMILATWYKQALKESLLATVYADQNKTKGVDVEDKEIKRKIYAQYLAAFEKGVYNYIKRDTDEETKKVTSRRYFSGGVDAERLPEEVARDSVKGKNGASSDLPAEDRVHLPGETAKDVAVQLSDLGPGSAGTRSVEAAVDAVPSVNIKNGARQVTLSDEEGALVVEFGTNGVRAPMYKVDEQGQKTAEGPFTPRFVSRVANAIVRGALTQIRAGQRKLQDAQKGLRVLVAYDGRQGARAFAEAAYQAVSAFEGISADLADGITNSPDAAFQSAKNYDVVIEITASHNPENDNGIKVFTEGMVAADQLAAVIQNEANSAEGRRAYYAQELDAAAVTTKNAYAESSGRKQSAFPQLAALVASYRQANPEAVMVVDLFGGAASRYAEEFERLGIGAVRSQPMSETQYRNRKGGPYAPNPTLRENYGPEFDAFVREALDGSVYFGLDGDVDRLVVWAKVNGQVKEINPNDLGMAYLDYLLTHPERLGVSLEGKKLVVGKTLPTTLGLDLLAQKHNAALSVVPVGSKNFRSLLENPENVVVVATEESGHQIVTVGGETFFDDAVTQMYLVLEMMGTLQKNPARIAQDARQAVGFGLDFGNTAVKLTPEIVSTFITQMTENPQVIVDRIEAAVGKPAAAIRVVSQKNTVEVYRPGETKLKPEQGLHFLFVDSPLGPLASLYFRKSGTEPIIRIYRESAGSNDILLELGKQAVGAASRLQAVGPGGSGVAGEGGIPGRRDAPSVQVSEFALGRQINDLAQIVSRQRNIAIEDASEQVRTSLAGSIDRAKVLNDFAESVGISAVQALKNMIAAGLAVQNPGQVGLNYSLTPGFFDQDTLERFRHIQIQSSQNPAMVDLALLRLERILLSAVNVDDFFAQLADGQRPADIVAALESQGLLSTLTAAWNRSQVEHQWEVRRKPLSVGDLVNPQTTAYYQSRGIDVNFSIPKQAAVGENQLAVLSAYQRVFAAEMARGEFNYRGTGTRQTVEQYFQESFMQRDYNRIRDFVRSLFPEGLDAIVTNGIGANDQFMWALVEMYNQNRGAGDPVWHHVITARDLVKLEGLNPERTLGIHISRSGSTWEGVEVASRLAAKGFNKMIVLANGGDLKAIADTVNKEKPGAAIAIGMQPDIGGRNMHRKTPIYYTAQTVAGMFVPQMDAPVFARLHHEFDQHNDFGNEQGLALNAARFLHGLMELRGVNHIAFMSNTTQTALMGSELSQYMMEGANKEHIISWGDHELGSEPAYVLENLTRGPAGQKVVGLAILDKASQHFERERARVEALKERIALITFVIDSRKQTADLLAGVRPEQQAAFDILWTDFITALTTFLRVDANSNPNVKVVRAMTADYVAKWRDISARYATDAIGSGKTKVLVSLGYPGKPEIGTPEKQIPLTPENLRDLARSLVQELDSNGMLTNRDRLNVFSGTENLVEVMKALRNGSYQTPLSTLLGWIFETGLYPGRAHKAHEATLAFSPNPERRLLANQSINVFLNQRSLGENPAFDEPFVDKTGTGKYTNVNGATLHQTNDSMTFPNIQRTAQVSPTVLLEFQTLTPEVRELLEAFYQAFLDELGKLPPASASSGINDPSQGPAGEDEAIVTPADTAQATTATDSFAGINLDPALLDLQIKRDGNGVPFPLPQQPVESMRIEGFIPIIINVTPVPNLPLLLGLTEPNGETPAKEKAPGSAQKPGPADIKTVRTGRKT